jgi:hypothetical protein
MGFRQPDLDSARSAIGRAIIEIKSPYNDGWTSSYVKHELYKLKCFLDDAYSTLPTFQDEEKWEKERLIDILKKDEF